MAHGTGMLITCCNQYSYMGRFSKTPTCPICKKKVKQITKSELDRKYRTSLLNFIYPNEGQWIKLEKR